MPKKQMDDARAQAELKKQQAQQQKELEQKMQQGHRLRLEHALAMNESLLDEQLELEYTQFGIRPNLRVIPITPEQQAINRDALQKAKAEFEAMVAGNVPASGLVGADGAPLESDNAA